MAANPYDELAGLLAELETYLPALLLPPGHLGFAVPLRLRAAAGELRLMTTISTFATAVDVTISELRLEAFLPVRPGHRRAPSGRGESSPGPFGQKRTVN